MIETATTVKSDLSDVLLGSALTDKLTYELSCLLVGANLASRTELWVKRRGRAESSSRSVVNKLCINVCVCAVNCKTRTLRCTKDLGTYAALAAFKTRLFRLLLVNSFSLETCHHLTG